MKNLFLVFLAVSIWHQNTYPLEGTWRGLKIAKEKRCSNYNREIDYPYSQSLEQKIVKSLGNKIYSPYYDKFFESTKETDIEHIVSLSEAHDSGLCSKDSATKIKFASDIRNLTLSSPQVNRHEKKGHDAQDWLPEKNQCWFAKTVLEVKAAYNLSVDSAELVSLEKVISNCDSFDMIVFKQKESPHKLIANARPQRPVMNEQTNKTSRGVNNKPNIKKSKSGICHIKESSSHYKRLKHFTIYSDLESCINSGGRCPKRDKRCIDESKKLMSETGS